MSQAQRTLTCSLARVVIDLKPTEYQGIFAAMRGITEGFEVEKRDDEARRDEEPSEEELPEKKNIALFALPARSPFVLHVMVRLFSQHLLLVLPCESGPGAQRASRASARRLHGSSACGDLL